MQYISKIGISTPYFRIIVIVLRINNAIFKDKCMMVIVWLPFSYERGIIPYCITNHNRITRSFSLTSFRTVNGLATEERQSDECNYAESCFHITCYLRGLKLNKRYDGIFLPLYLTEQSVSLKVITCFKPT